MPRILITGATGLIGGHAASLWAERGWRVRAVVRPSSDVTALEALGCELVIGDLTDPASIRGAAQGCEVVLHAAAFLGLPGGWERYREGNVEATRNALSEALERRASRFLHVSTAAVYGPPSAHPRLPIDEEAPLDLPLPEEAFYERSKRMAEALVRAVPAGRLGWTILRPDVVVGEGDRHFTRRIVELTRLPILPLAGAGDNPLPVVYAHNVGLALWLAAEREEAVGRTYNVVGDGRLTQRELYEVAASPRSPHLVSVPPLLMRGAAAALEWSAALPWVGGKPRLTRERVWFLAHPDPFDGGRIRRELGWDPPVSTLEGWRRSVDWYRGTRLRVRPWS